MLRHEQRDQETHGMKVAPRYKLREIMVSSDLSSLPESRDL